MQWHTQCTPVENPYDNPKWWRFPYQGDDLPTKDDWYWVFAGRDGREPYRSTPAKKAWWDGGKQRFLAMTSDVIAWRNIVVANSLLDRFDPPNMEK